MAITGPQVEKIKNIGLSEFNAGTEILNGIVSITGEITDYTAADIASRLLVLARLMDGGDSELDTLILRMYSCPGGDVDASFATVDLLHMFCKEHDLVLRIEAYGCVASAAIMIMMQAGDVRAVGKSSVILIHEPKMFIFDETKTSDLKDIKLGMDMISKMMFELMAARCGKTVEEIEEFVDRKERWMTAQEAKDWNLIDEIM